MTSNPKTPSIVLTAKIAKSFILMMSDNQCHCIKRKFCYVCNLFLYFYDDIQVLHFLEK